MKKAPGFHAAFWREPDLMAEVAKSIEDRDFDILDIGYGMPCAEGCQ